jgi:hypothetical protein
MTVMATSRKLAEPPTTSRRVLVWVVAATIAFLSGSFATVHARAAAATHFSVSAPGISAAGSAFTITVTALDGSGATETHYAGVVRIVANDPQATLPANYRFVTADHGVHTFTNAVTLRTAGPDEITVTDTNDNTITGSTTVTVSFGPTSHFLFYAGFASTTPGELFSLDATALDQYGNTVTSYRGTVHFTGSDGGASFPPNYTFTGSENGTHFWPNSSSLRTAGSQTVSITDANDSSVTSQLSVTVYTTCPQSPTRAVLAGEFSGHPPIGLLDELAIVTNAGVCVLSTGVRNSFRPGELWTGPFYGTRATLAADVNGDGLVDLIAVNDTTTFVMYSNGHGFSAPTLWSRVTFYGSRGTFAADITGTGDASLVAVNDVGTWVMTSDGSAFSAPSEWSNQPFYGSRATLMTDAAELGRHDLVAVDNGSTWVMTSTGTSFNPPTQWSSQPFYGNVTTLAPLEGIGEVVAVNRGGAWLMSSTGLAFSAPSLASSTAFYGTQATLLACLHGGTSAPDLAAVNGSSIWVENSLGGSFSAPVQWASSVP